MPNIQEFIDSIEVPNTERVVRYVLNGVDTELENLASSDLKRFILSREPNSQREIMTICYVLGLYARWLDKNGFENGIKMYERIQQLDKKDLWKRAKPAAKKKFITHMQFCRVVNEIGIGEEFNQLYYQTLFRSVYEGIYNDDMSVVKNLRASDVCGDRVTLREDSGHTYTIKITKQLADDLVRVANQCVWERRNRNGICRVQMRGCYKDSVFKIEERKSANSGETDSFKFSYYAKLRKITDEYLEYRVLPLALFVSGIMHRIIVRLNQNSISLTEAFADSNNRSFNDIIQAELLRCNYSSGVNNFRDIVKGHLEQF